MSQQEFEQADDQVLSMVNDHAHPDAKKAAEKICCANPAENARAAEQRRRILWTVLQVLCCVLVAALFVAALLDPSFVMVLVNAGVLVCGMVAAILVDRSIRHLRGR